MTGADMAKRQNELSVWAVARTSFAVFVLSGVLLAPAPSLSQTLPTGGNVTHGAATIAAPQGSTLNISQTSNRAIINWNSFSVGAGGRVNFNQPSTSAATLNRVTGTTSSTIAGAITAPGTVLLINPNGIAITPTGTVNVGSFAASTLDIKNSDFLAGNYKFTGNGTSATVTNAGRINVSDGGFAALLGGRVANDGIITARLGRVGLGSGERITLDLAGDGFLSVEVPSNQLGNLHDGTGQSLVSNRGKIRADGGIVHLSAATANAILRDAVNVPGSIRANSVGTRGGRIVLGGGAGGRVNVSGRISASGTRVARRHAPAAGGQIDISGAEIALTGARLNVSGDTGGGSVRIGGDYLGSGDFPHAQRVSIDSASVIRADATQNGNGGTVIVWSDGVTSVSGAFSARGGANGGNGGLVETSGHELSFNGVRVDTSAARGKTGEWLLDPESLTVDSAAASTISTNLATANVTLLTTSTTASGPGSRWAGAGDIFVRAPIYWTSGNMLRLNAYNSIYINASIIGGSGSTLWLTTGGSGVVQQTAPISVTNLVLPLNFSSVTLNNSGNVVANLRTDDSSIDPNGDTFNGNPGALSFTNNGNLTTGLIYARNLALNVAGSLTATSVINGATNSSATVTSIQTSGNITFGTSGALVGTDITVTAGGSIAFNALTAGGTLSIRANGSISFEQNVTDFWGRPITSTSIRSDNGLVTFAVRNNQIRQIYTSGPVEILYNPYAVYGTYANVSTYSGLTSGVGNGSVTVYMLVNDLNQLSNIETNLAGTYALGRDIDASGSVNMTCLQSICAGFRPIGRSGGFTGLFDGRGFVISNLYQNWQTALVGTQGVGLFSINRGTIRNVGIVGGNLVGIGNSGGLVADNYGTVSNSYSTAAVRGIQDSNGNASVGGLVGLNRGTVNAGSYASGTVRGIWVGGLVGENRGTINDSYAAANVTGSYAGGLVGFNHSGAVIRWTYSLSAVNGSIYTGGLVGVNHWGGGYGSVIESYAAGRLSGSGIGGLVGENRFQDQDTMESFNAQYGMSARVWNSYWDVVATGTTRSFGRSYHDAPGGWTSEQIMNVASVGGSGPLPYTQDAYWYFRNPTLYDPHSGNTNGINWDQYGFNGHWYIIEGETRPFLRSEYSTNIQNLHQLQLVNMNGAANYRIAREINASAELASGMWNNNSFSPIRPVNWTDNLVRNYVEVFPGTGNYVQVSQYYDPTATLSAFTGSLDGQGHTISNVYVNRWFPITNYYSSMVATGQNAGLFDTISGGGSVRNLGVVDSVFMASSGNAGSIAGTNGGTIERSWAERGGGTYGLNVMSDGIGGGLVGYNTGRISQSYSSVYVYGVGQSTQDWQSNATNVGL
jgi:filamentous hemagglutinin family protein